MGRPTINIERGHMHKLTIKIDVANEEEARALEIFVKAAPEVRSRILLSAMTGTTQDDPWEGMQTWKINWAVFPKTGGLSGRAFGGFGWVESYNESPDFAGMCSCCHKEGPRRRVTLFLKAYYRIDLTLCETCMTRTDIVEGATPEDRVTGADAKGLPTDSFLEYLLSKKYQTYDLFLTTSRKGDK